MGDPVKTSLAQPVSHAGVSCALAKTPDFTKLPPMKKDITAELRRTARAMKRVGFTTWDWAIMAKVDGSTLWRILERGQTPSIVTYTNLMDAANNALQGCKESVKEETSFATAPVQGLVPDCQPGS